MGGPRDWAGRGHRRRLYRRVRQATIRFVRAGPACSLQPAVGAVGRRGHQRVTGAAGRRGRGRHRRSVVRPFSPPSRHDDPSRCVPCRQASQPFAHSLLSVQLCTARCSRRAAPGPASAGRTINFQACAPMSICFDFGFFFFCSTSAPHSPGCRSRCEVEVGEGAPARVGREETTGR